MSISSELVRRPGPAGLQSDVPVIHIQTQNNGDSSRVHNGPSYYNGKFILPADVARDLNATALTNLARAAETACDKLSAQIDRFQSAPLYIHGIAQEADAISHSLTAFQSQLADEESMRNIVWAATFDNIGDVIRSCISDSGEISNLIEEYAGNVMRETSKFSAKHRLTSANVDVFRERLREHKHALGITIATANFGDQVSSKTHIFPYQNEVEKYREQVRTTLLRIDEDETASRFPSAFKHTETDRQTLPYDPDYIMERFRAASITSTTTTRQDPSMQASTFLESYVASTIRTFHTAETSLDTIGSQVFIKGLPGLHLMVMSIQRSQTLRVLTNDIRSELGLPNASFRLLLGNRILERNEDALEFCGISHNSTIHCVSFRSNKLDPGPWSWNIFSRAARDELWKFKAGESQNLEKSTDTDILCDEVSDYLVDTNSKLSIPFVDRETDHSPENLYEASRLKWERSYQPFIVYEPPSNKLYVTNITHPALPSFQTWDDIVYLYFIKATEWYPTSIRAIALGRKLASNENSTFIRALKLGKLGMAVRMRRLTGTINTMYVKGVKREESEDEDEGVQETFLIPSPKEMANNLHINANSNETQRTQKAGFTHHSDDVDILWLMELLQHHQKCVETMRFRKLVASLDYYQDREATLSRKMALTDIEDMINILETLIDILGERGDLENMAKLEIERLRWTHVQSDRLWPMGSL